MKNVIYVVDADDASRQFVVQSLISFGYTTFDFRDADSFLSSTIVDHPSCLILELNIPVIEGFRIIDVLKKRGCAIPILVLTDSGSIPLCVRALKAGVQDFLTKPVDIKQLISTVKDILKDAAENFYTQQKLFELCKNYQTLTRREIQIFEFIINGLQNKQIASELGISEITVKVHRRSVMNKMKVRTLADLVHAAGSLQIGKSRCKPR